MPPRSSIQPSGQPKDDNPFAESLFRTLKYSHTYPAGGFTSIDAARVWGTGFVRWHNEEHLHSGISYQLRRSE